MDTVLYDFDDVISIVNDRHEHCRFHEYVQKEHKKEKERLRKERLHIINKKIIRCLSNTSYFMAGGCTFAAFLLTAEGHHVHNYIMSAFAVISAGLAVYFSKRANNYDE